MSSTFNSVGAMLTYMSQSAAAVNTSSSPKNGNSSKSASTSFNDIFNKTTDIKKKPEEVSTFDDFAKKSDISDKLYQLKENDSFNKGGNENVAEIDYEAPDSLPELEPDINFDVDISHIDEGEVYCMEADDKLQEAVLEAGKELVSKIAKELEINEEDIYTAMETLGLMATDLLKPENIQLLVTDIIGEDKTLDLLTDSDLYTSMQDLCEDADSMRSELMNEFSLSDKDFESLLVEKHDNFGDFRKEINDVSLLPEEKRPEIIVNEAGEDISKDIRASQSKEQPLEIQVEAESEEINTKEFKPIVELNETHRDYKGTNGEMASNLLKQFVDNMADAVDLSSDSMTSYTDRAQMEDIVRQITDKITLSTGNGESSMELQLHPAHLGNVNILLTSTKDGIVAKFTAQNEIVKEAVESQMVQLQQKFDEQGVKVTAIEVTIASHAFEQNFQQDNKNQSFEQEKERPRKTLRRLNLSELGDVADEELSDADMVAAKVMEMNGNSVDYSA
ncbi:MAG: flagellar hook-length control protein FliK [Butyrivibrio sp.]|uniref:flagellar hook-length control protein FliK n=1 Tax=Butyrivibrio sp. TaxID=28121 RepID=UPI001B2B79BE|nr:flagellar hook-length control protein FliK [Butyrivibrio sp.]MBO6242485.1 flagellar hook-length control protein FliK [Butyrivibrio sp.]